MAYSCKNKSQGGSCYRPLSESVKLVFSFSKKQSLIHPFFIESRSCSVAHFTLSGSVSLFFSPFSQESTPSVCSCSRGYSRLLVLGLAADDLLRVAPPRDRPIHWQPKQQLGAPRIHRVLTTHTIPRLPVVHCVNTLRCSASQAPANERERERSQPASCR